MLAYDNARLPQAMILTGAALKRPALVEAGLASLRWLMALQTAPNGDFRPVGTGSFGAKRTAPEAFDQQPVEAAATISACIAAWRVNECEEWLAGAVNAFQWFVGSNDLRSSLIDTETGGCMDGLHPDRPNENRGAEFGGVLPSRPRRNTSVCARGARDVTRRADAETGAWRLN